MKLDDENGYSEDEKDEDSVCENHQVKYLSEYPDPFEGTEEENVYEFIKKVETAFFYNRVREVDKNDVLRKLVIGDAEGLVREFKSLNENFTFLKKVFGNPHAIWKKEKDRFLRRSRQEVKNWTDQFSPERKLMLVKVLNFLEYAKGLAKKFEAIKEDVFSSSTLESIMAMRPGIGFFFSLTCPQLNFQSSSTCISECGTPSSTCLF